MRSYIEIVPKGRRGEYFAEVMADQRDRSFYGLVHDADDGRFLDNQPVFTFRGLPPDTDPIIREDFEGCYGASWLTKTELESLLPCIKREDTRHRLNAILAAMNSLEEDTGSSTRFVFWFID